MYPICYRRVSSRYFQPEPAMYSRCFHWFPGPLTPSDKACITARHAGFLVWLRWDHRYPELEKVPLHPAQCVSESDIVVMGCQLSVNMWSVSRGTYNVACFFLSRSHPLVTSPNPPSSSMALKGHKKATEAFSQETNEATGVPSKRTTRSVTKNTAISPKEAGEHAWCQKWLVSAHSVHRL